MLSFSVSWNKSNKLLIILQIMKQILWSSSSPPPAVPPPASSAPPWCAAPRCPGSRAPWGPVAAAPSAAWPPFSLAGPGTASPVWSEWPGSRLIQMLLHTHFPEISLACYRWPVPPKKQNTSWRQVTKEVRRSSWISCKTFESFLFM